MTAAIGSRNDESSSSSAAGKCPVDLETRSLWNLWGSGKGDTVNTAKEIPGKSATNATIPASLEEAARHAQTPQPDQRLPLSTHRLASTIPRSRTTQASGTTTTPAHQVVVPHANDSADDNSTWVYPSEQQVFNAMKRKGWRGIEEESIPSFLQIHNSVNERSWRQVQRWEASETVELSRFEGRPNDLTPKAWFLSALGLRDRPFDRHDWYVVDANGSPERRYVLDFYMTDDARTSGLPRVDIDVRPALDDPAAVWQRGRALLREAFPGIARELDERLR